MPRSKKNTQRACCETTFHGLHKWVSHSFEHLGWMLLAKSHGHDEKVQAYLSSLERLEEAIEHRLSHIREVDRQHDLRVLADHVRVLKTNANELLQ